MNEAHGLRFPLLEQEVRFNEGADEMKGKQTQPRRLPEAGSVLEFRQRQQKYPLSSTEVQVCLSCGTTFHVPSSSRCRSCLAFMLHYRACCLLREVVS